MIKFFRKIRQQLLDKNQVRKYLVYAVGEIVLVVFGILIALQLNNWNQSRQERQQEQVILRQLDKVIRADIGAIDLQISAANNRIGELKTCLNILSEDSDGSLELFRENFHGILTLIDFDMNKTTYNSITNAGSIEFIRNKSLIDSLDLFYNTDYKGWDTANKDYTRNVIGPYLMQFDHIPRMDYSRYADTNELLWNKNFSDINVSQFEVKPRALNAYKEDIFIINILRQKLWLTEGQAFYYENLKNTMERLAGQINAEIH